MAIKRPGQAQLAAWISSESMARLKALATEHHASIREILERAIAGYAGHAPATPATADADRLDDLEARIADHESRLSAIETMQPMDAVLDAALDTALDTALDNEPDAALEEVIAILARQGLKPQAIANELDRLGHRTKTGNVIKRGDSRIARAIKALSSQQLD